MKIQGTICGWKGIRVGLNIQIMNAGNGAYNGVFCKVIDIDEDNVLLELSKGEDAGAKLLTNKRKLRAKVVKD